LIIGKVIASILRKIEKVKSNNDDLQLLNIFRFFWSTRHETGSRKFTKEARFPSVWRLKVFGRQAMIFQELSSRKSGLHFNSFCELFWYCVFTWSYLKITISD